MTEHDHDLHARMERAVDGLHAPDLARATIGRAAVRRRRKHTAYAVGGVAAIALAGAVGIPRVDTDQHREVQVATQAPSLSATSTPSDDCGRPAGWWNMPGSDVRASLASRLPSGAVLGATDESAPGVWAGNVDSGEDSDFVQVVLHPPAGSASAPAGSLEALRQCGQGTPPSTECADDTGCTPVVDGNGRQIGALFPVSESGGGVDLRATLRGPGGGVIEIWTSEGTRADRPDTVHDPADRPAFTPEELEQLVTDPVWTSWQP